MTTAPCGHKARFLRYQKVERTIRCSVCLSVRRVPCGYCKGRGFTEWADGKSLRQRRLAVGLGLREMARRLKITAAYLCDVELNRRRATEKIRAYYENL